MDAIPAPNTPGRSRSQTRWTRLGPWVFALGLSAMVVDVAAQEQVAAVWKERRISFDYISSTTVYSCHALTGRVASILRAIGARDDVKVTVSGCGEAVATLDPRMNPGSRTSREPASAGYRDYGNDRHHLATVYVRLMMPIEVTEEVLAELKRDKSRRELVSHVTGNPAARFDDPILFRAQRELVTLSHETIGMEPEECELLDQMSARVFPQLDVRVVEKGFLCQAGSHIAPRLVAEALVATPYKPPELPPIGTEVPGPGTPDPSGGDAAHPASDSAPQ